MCEYKGFTCTCGACGDGLTEAAKVELQDTKPYEGKMADKPKNVEVEVEEIVEINGVQYVRKNKKTLIEEPVILENDGKQLLTE